MASSNRCLATAVLSNAGLRDYSLDLAETPDGPTCFQDLDLGIAATHFETELPKITTKQMIKKTIAVIHNPP